MKSLITKIINFIKQHKTAVISSLAVVLVLAASFVFFGNESPNSQKELTKSSYSAEDSTDETQKSDLIVSATESSKSTEPQNSESSKSDESSNSAADDNKGKTDSGESFVQNQTVVEPNVSPSPYGDNQSHQDSESKQESESSSSDGKDKYLTDPIPEGKPKPVEPQDQEIEDKTLYCTFSISCATILDNMKSLRKHKADLVPSDGWILKPQKVEFNEGESVFDVLQRVCKENKIHMEATWTPIYNSSYVEGIGNLYEFDCGNQSGWMYKVNDWFPNYGCSRYELKNGDTVEWKYTCKGYGLDVGASMPMGG